ncbi:MAG: Ppx/GppA family phosphatase, partial [Pseudomonadota bacterium]
MNAGAEHSALQRIKQAVIDIGSNSVRLVIYDGPRRAPFPICNEKSLCGLGRDTSEDGRLNPRAVESALETLARFKRLLAEHGDPAARTVATAAVREAKDGPQFVERVRALGLEVETIGGREEASLAAFGVASFEPGATGLVGDMGGGSLELVAVNNGVAGDAVSLSIGPLRLMQHSKGDLKAAAREIDQALASVTWLKDRRPETLYAVGGAWRAIARINMQLRRHPLPVLHHYELSARQAIETCDLVARQSRSSLEVTPGVSAKRIDTIPFAAIVMRRLLEDARINKISVSAGGLREG